MRAQASVEYLIILGIALFLLVPIIVLFYSSSVESQSVTDSNLNTINGRKIISSAENVFYQGKNSKLRLTLTFPENIEKISIKNGSLVITSDFDGDATDFVFFTDIPLYLGDCDASHLENTSQEFVSGGTKSIFVKSCGRNVTIYPYED